MSGVAIVTMVVICGSVWGGFVLLLARALRCEKARNAESRDSAGADGR